MKVAKNSKLVRQAMNPRALMSVSESQDRLVSVMDSRQARITSYISEKVSNAWCLSIHLVLQRSTSFVCFDVGASFIMVSSKQRWRFGLLLKKKHTSFRVPITFRTLGSWHAFTMAKLRQWAAQWTYIAFSLMVLILPWTPFIAPAMFDPPS